MAKIEVTQTRSPIGRTKNQRSTLKTLGLHRIGDSNVVEDRPEIRGMINSIPHLVSFKEVD